MSERHHAAHHRPAHPFMLSEGRSSGSLCVKISPEGLRPHTPRVRRAHHHAFQHGLAADQSGLFATLQGREQLHRCQKTQNCAANVA